MARTRTLLQLRSDARILADRVNITTRHPDSQLTRWINEEIQHFRNKVSDNGHEYYLTESTATTVADQDWLALPSDFLAMKGVSITINSRLIRMLPYDLAERHDFESLFPGDTGRQRRPMFWRLQGQESGTGDVIRFVPKPDTAYTITYFYIPVLTDLVSDGDTFDGIAGWEDWVTHRVALKILRRDKRVGPQHPEYAGLMDGLAEMQGDLEWLSKKRARGAPLRMRDTFRERQRVRSLARWQIP